MPSRKRLGGFQTEVGPLQLPQPPPLLTGQHITALTTIRLILPQPVTQRLLGTPQLRRQLLGRPIPTRNNLIASRRNSGGYGGRVLAILRSSLGLSPTESRCQPDRGNSNSRSRLQQS